MFGCIFVSLKIRFIIKISKTEIVLFYENSQQLKRGIMYFNILIILFPLETVSTNNIASRIYCIQISTHL